MGIEYRGTWDAAGVARYLDERSVPLRLGCTTASGWPLVVSLWFWHREDVLWCATQEDARIVGHLLREPRCGFEVGEEEPPYAGIRGQGRAEICKSDGPRVLDRLIERYVEDPEGSFARWLRSRREHEVAIRIEPVWISSWDFTARMRSGS